MTLKHHFRWAFSFCVIAVAFTIAPAGRRKDQLSSALAELMEDINDDLRALSEKESLKIKDTAQ